MKGAFVSVGIVLAISTAAAPGRLLGQWSPRFAGAWSGTLHLTGTAQSGTRGRVTTALAMQADIAVDGRIEMEGPGRCEGEGAVRLLSGGVALIDVRLNGCGEPDGLNYTGALQMSETVMSVGASHEVVVEGRRMARRSLTGTLHRVRD